jgi:PAS domain S-box-containing protein
MSERSFSLSGDELVPSSEDRRDPEQAAALRETAEVNLWLAIDAIPTIVWSHSPDGSGDYFNKSWVEYTNLSPEESKGFGWSKALHPEDLPAYLDDWRKALATRQPFQNEARFRRADGRYRWFLVRGIPLRDEAGDIVKWYGQLTDIEDCKRAEARVSQAETELRLALDTIPALAWKAGPNGYSEFVNRGWLEYTNMSLEDTMGSGWASSCQPDDRTRFVENFVKAIAAGKPYEDEGRFRRADGQYRWFLIRGTPFRDEAGNIVRWYGANFDIEDRKRAEARVGQAEAGLRLAMDTIPALAWSAGPDGGADFVNRGWTEYTNLSLEDTKGSGWSSRIHPDDRDRFVDKFLKAVAAGTPYEDEGRIRRADGQYRWFLVRGTPFRDEAGAVIRWYGVCTDIEDRRRAEKALRDSEQRFRDFSEATADWYWETGPDHRFTYVPVERAASANVSNADRIRIGATRWEIAADVETEPAKWQDHIDVLNAHKPFRGFVYQVRLKDGSAMYVAASGIPRFDGNSRFLGYRGGASDVTAVVRADLAEKSLRQAQVELAHVTRVTTLGELTASIAHEVNQPLAGVIGNGTACLRWLSKDPPPFDEVRASVEAMMSDAERASVIIAKIRALAQNAAPQMAILDINEVVGEAVALVRRELDDHGVVLRLELASGTALVTGDRIQLQQVIINLIMNSIEAMESITERARQVVIRSHRSGNNRIAVQVQDSGVGVEPANLDRVFGAFFTTKSKGLGMGLSISRSIVEAHDGRLKLSSDGATGATVEITLPPYQSAR